MSTLTGDHNNRITDYTSVIVDVIPIQDQATRYAGKRGTKQDGKGNGLGVGDTNDPMYTITSGDKHAVCCTYQQVTGPLMANSHPGSYSGQDAYNDMFVAGEEVIAFDRATYNQGQNALYDFEVTNDGINSTIVAKGPGGVCYRHIVRRLTPTECAMLQGFPRFYGKLEPKDELSDEEYEFWLEVRNTHAMINNKTVKPYTKEQMLKWYNKLHTDGAEYKMWGNGIALPCALYVMEGIAEALQQEEGDINEDT